MGFAPKETWAANPTGPRQSIDEAIQVATQHGVQIPADVRFRLADATETAELQAESKLARGSPLNERLDGRVYWQDLFHPHTRQTIFIVRPDVLERDEAIVAVFTHELFEFEALRQLFADEGGSMFAADFNDHTRSDLQNNLHYQAWDAADAAVRRMRGQP
jgi:hypothetical protein